jgi:hypothetical protein
MGGRADARTRGPADARTRGHADDRTRGRTDVPAHLARGRMTVAGLALAVLAGVATPGAAQQRPAVRPRAAAPAQARLANPLPPLRQQAEIRAEWTRFRLDSVLPALLRKYDVQMWVVCGRENNEDPVYGQLVPALGASMGRRTILVFFDRGPDQPLERLAIGSGSSGLYRTIRDTALARRMGSFGQDRFELLRRVVEERNPRTIAIDVSEGDAYADGLSAGDEGQLQAALGAQFWPRVRHAEGLVLDYFAVRAPAMMDTYLPLQRLAHDIIATAFSNKVIRPGVTRADDVAWWARQELADLGLGAWFNPYITVQRRGADGDTLQNPVLLPGDVLHIDFGITGLGLNTDTQHMAYILRPGETAPPPGLVAALHNTNRLQDIVLGEMRAGRTGNEVLTSSLAAMAAAGITGAVYGHPVGDHGHAAGPYVGLFDRQAPIAGRGDVRFLPNTWHSIELQATTAVPEWGDQPVVMYEEEDAVIDAAGTARWVHRRQAALLVIR